MKIQGPNSTSINPYKKQLQKQQQTQQKQTYKDQLNISKEAKQLQESNQLTKERAAYVQDIKKLVDSGQYEVKHEEVAQKMIDFWTRRT